MDMIKFSDWQDLGLKKDVEKINRQLAGKKTLNIVILIEIMLSSVTVALTGLGVGEKSKVINLIAITIASLAVLVPIGFGLYYWIYKYYKNKKDIKQGKYNISHYVDNFDNKILNYSMMASSLVQYIKAYRQEIAPETIYSIISEAHYFINKCISELNTIREFVDKVISDKHKRVSPSRLYMLVKHLKILRAQLAEEQKAIKDSKRDSIIDNYLESTNKEYDGIMQKFLGICEENKVNITITWL